MPRPAYYCQYVNCTTTSLTPGRRLYRFPKEEERCEKWILATKNPKLKGKPAVFHNKNSRLCDNHFADWCFMNAQDRSRLVFNAVPDAEKKTCAAEQVTPETVTLPDSPVPPVSRISFILPVIKIERPSEQDSSSSSNNTILRIATTSKQIPSLEAGAAAISKQPPFLEVHAATTSKQTPFLEIGTAATSKQIPSLGIGTAATSKQTPSLEAQKFAAKRAQLAKIIKRKNDALRKLKIRVQQLKQSLTAFKKPRMQLLRWILQEEGVSEYLTNFIVRQVKLCSSKYQSRRFSSQEKTFAYNVLCESKAAYKVLKNLIELPSEATLRRYVSTVTSNSEEIAEM